MQFLSILRSSVRFAVIGTILAGLVLVAAAPAQGQAVKTGTALSVVPADASFYVSNLRNKEQMDLFLKSNAYKSVRNLPLAKMAVEKIKEALKDKNIPNNPLKMYEKFMEDQDNKDLVKVILDAVSEEIFVYGGKSWGDVFKVLTEVNNAQSFAPLKAFLENADPQKAQTRGILLALQANREKLKVPELVFGFKVKDGKNTTAQIKRLEDIFAGLRQVFPILKGKINTKKIANGDFLTFEADGTLIPWDDINLKDYEEQKDEFEPLVKHIKKMTLSVSLGVSGDYLLFGITSSNKEIERFDGKQVSLSEREEFQPLAKHAKEPLTGISYISKEFIKALTRPNTSYAEVASNLKALLEKADIKEEHKKAIGKDLEELMTAMSKAAPDYGAVVSYSFMTPTGYEGHVHNYTKPAPSSSSKLTLHNHFGGDPIFAAAFSCKVDGSGYREMVRWIKKIHGHAEAIFLDKAPEEAKEPYERFTKAVFPIFRKIDENTNKKFIPAIKDTGLGLVVDGKWTSKQWLKELPATPKAMPMPELGLLLGISDAKQFEDALKNYRLLVNELIEAVRGAVPNGDNIPPIKIPAPEREEGKGGVLVYYPIPEELRIDKQFQPVAGIAKTLSVISLSKTHGERIMAVTPMKLKSKPLSHKGDLNGVAIIDWPAFVAFADPWVELGVRTALSQIKEAKDIEPNSAVKQARVILAAMKAFKSASTVTYIQDNRTISHTEIIIKDLAREVPADDEPAPSK